MIHDEDGPNIEVFVPPTVAFCVKTDEVAEELPGYEEIRQDLTASAEETGLVGVILGKGKATEL